jgi:hypothetical protein
MPGAGEVSDLAKRKALEPLKPTTPQQPLEFGLFGDHHKQKEFDLCQPTFDKRL